MPQCIVQRADGVYADLDLLGASLLAAIDNIFGSDRYFSGLDYPVLIRALYGHGPELRPVPGLGLRIADDIAPFEPRRRALYRSVKIAGGQADYYFEPVFLDDPDDPDAPGIPASLDLDEFIADMWCKGIRFGIDVQAVRAAIDSRQAGRLLVASRLEPMPGQDARVIEVSDDIHRNNAPRQLANGKLDLMTFQNRFPQIREGERLLKKLPPIAGTPGCELSGIPIAPSVPKDLELAVYAGDGTRVERTGEGEFLVAQQSGFLNVDSKTSRLSVGDKIVSHDGVSVKTTGNLKLEGDFEEFGEVQENRVIEGEGITVHADVFGHIVSRGGTVRLNRNLVGGSVQNQHGDVHIKGVASGAVVQTKRGVVALQRAENCVVTGTRVTIGQAINCDILGDEVQIEQAEGCAIGALRVTIGSAAPRRQAEMVVLAMYPECGPIIETIGQVHERVEQLAQLAAHHKAAMERLIGQPEVRRYMLLATRVRKNELTLNADQQAQFRKMAQAVAPALQEIARASAAMKAAEADQRSGLELLAQLERQRSENAQTCTVSIAQVAGDTQVRAAPFHPGDASVFDLPSREVRARVREMLPETVLFAGCDGAFEWSNTGA
ncbi:DUF342 domain-containing protein [Massilia horti]|uniref:DUF342 domain-containing protein n=1 Tax=Massilia horti TaxID=2562153 RepID=A0A4Y9SXI3_9BURK|nr:DUF342 domain-containing protein [Massilia horti]